MRRSIVIQASARSEGDSSLIAQYAADTLGCPPIDLLSFNFSGYDYQSQNKEDDFLPLMRSLVKYDCLIFVTPVYWYSMSGLLKNFFDRITDCLKIEKETGRQLRGMQMAAMSCSNTEEGIDGFFTPFRLSAEYLGMGYLGDLHCWVASGEIPAEVGSLLDEFLMKIKSD